MISWLLILPFFPFLNRVRGGGASSITDKLPGRALYYVSFLLASLVFLVTQSWIYASCVFLGFLIWGAPGWGLWFDLHRNDAANDKDPRRQDPFVRFIDTISFRNDYLAMFWRMFLFVIPFLVSVAYFGFTSFLLIIPIALLFSIALVICYEVGHRTPLSVTLAEYLTGVVWWIMILLIYSV